MSTGDVIGVFIALVAWGVVVWFLGMAVGSLITRWRNRR